MASFISGVVGDYLAREFHGRFQLLTPQVTLGTSWEEILSNDPERAFIAIVNPTVNTVNINVGMAGSAGRSFVLAPGGGMMSFNLKDDIIMPSLSFWGVSSASPTVLGVYAVRRYAPAEEETQNAT